MQCHLICCRDLAIKWTPRKLVFGRKDRISRVATRRSRNDKILNLKIKEVTKVQHYIIEIIVERLFKLFEYLKKMISNRFYIYTGVECGEQEQKGNSGSTD